MGFTFLALASTAYAVGGLFMKQSNGASQPGPTAVFLLLFGAGATLQAIGMRHQDMAVSYVIVLGLEAIVATALGVAWLHEGLPPARMAAIALIVAAIAWLRQT